MSAAFWTALALAAVIWLLVGLLCVGGRLR